MGAKWPEMPKNPKDHGLPASNSGVWQQEGQGISHKFGKFPFCNPTHPQLRRWTLFPLQQVYRMLVTSIYKTFGQKILDIGWALFLYQ